MDFGFIPILVVLAVVAVRMSKEFKKVSQGRPHGGGVPGAPSSEGGARDLFEFLEELRKQNAPLQDDGPPPLDPAEEAKARQRTKVREAVKRRQAEENAVSSGSFEESPRLPVAAKAVPRRTVSEVDAFALGKLESVAGDGAAAQPAGLTHDVFLVNPADPRDMAKRAIVLREVLGPPLALR